MRPRLTGFRSTSRRTPPARVRALPMRRVIVKEAPQKFVRRPEYSMCSTNWFACKNLAVLLIATSVWSQANKAAPVTPPAVATPATAASPVNSDPSQQAIVFEHFATKIFYEADGGGTQETAVTMHVQSQAGVQALAVLTFTYSSYNQTVELDYVRVKKPDGSVVVTPDYNVQDMPADVTHALMYSDIHEKHVTVKALGVGDLLEYVVRYRTIEQVPGQFWFQYSFAKDYIVRPGGARDQCPRRQVHQA